jgi:hypothetical protein
MKVLVSTTQTQGWRANDFCYVPEGELVAIIGAECTYELPDGRCGCKRSLSGLANGKGTTTVKVIDAPITRNEYWIRVIEKNKEFVGSFYDTELEDIAEEVDFLLKAASYFEIGAVLERRGNELVIRDEKWKEERENGYQ